MNADAQKVPSTRELLCFLEGEVTRSEADDIAAALAASPAARAAEARLQAMLAAVRAPAAEVEGEDLVAGVRATIAAAPPRRAARRWPAWTAAVALGCAAAAGLILWVRGPRLGPEEGSGFRPKAAAAPVEEPWVALEIYHLPAGGSPGRLGAHLPRGDGLLAAYSNLGRTPYTHLMVFAINAEGAVYWLYPAYTRPGTDPTAVPITGGARQQLPDLVHHDLAPGPLVFYGLFTRRPVRVSEVEAAVGAAVRAKTWNARVPRPLPLESTAHALVPTEVAP
ncbi:MAG TPA: hypothetical protein VGQ83_07880 [Polyangia bacterium]|jgi:hypothetical protein